MQRALFLCNLDPMYRIICAVVLAVLALSVAAAEDPESETATEKRWSDLLPLMKDLALEHMPEGQELPLPFGISASIIALKRDSEVK